VKIAKEFHWEMGHRLPEHFGKCKNIHGHSYRMIVELEGSLNGNGMIMDYYDLKKLVAPVIEELDHAFMVYREDKEIISFLESVKSKKVIVGFQSTVENICKYILAELSRQDLPPNVKKMKVRIFESIDDYAEEEAVIG
jgi:6-pyruvoyltetrahydropterin/6-carboxytetrahydropterin synthase